ncbi:MAG: glycine--tRNA ligase [Candidatus Yanofskybacteria bacterium RIFCSPHIGHO2_02_FULL_41_29]|uniref:glycine--tRNA ligase n=1 Tax=Candidatus Yanofskybacteria bacterium RIFCSPHIGHO2_01_FULL_41_53 TaxID=1802663 RepID=A0A1F8EJJ4_9BACT|nr:MAG: glycine--tRNA ligase [Candidatus Yanofskybacteria bacterium RIFCSPHIGHO2_01_FULL_41_53]OGN12193.1 MAG: glycine--tRNA ligase [Candidatus Yanofskybacteria bacterium RIFCSPHIGHO2_02_FULL_41_29]OGN28543.1 MAG: glycine--tRNA ligase [Candidatus Yanofskybacteria bacterium RIFCSPLOWO2_02_FULL_41_13]
MDNNLLEKVVSLCKRRGFIFPGSEIYGGLRGTWDYGPLGTELKFNLKQSWWEYMVQDRENVFGMNASIMMNPKVWEASGHVASFTDPLVECKTCHERFRADKAEDIKEHEQTHAKKKEKVEWTEPKQFNILVEAKLGVVEGEKTTVFLRGEITQGVHVNFKNVLDSMRPKIPFGIAQIGKAFRNEITPRNFIFRSREFEQMEMQTYVKPNEKEAMGMFNEMKDLRMKWYLDLGIKKSKLRFREHAPDERAHYAQAAWDIEYETPWGWDEAEGIHHRGDWDLSRHSEFSGQDLSYFDSETNERFIPWVIETSGGVDRALLFFLLNAYYEEKDRLILKLHPKLAPYKAAVFPLLANKPQLIEKARRILKDLKRTGLNVAWDDRGNIGKRYYSQDEIGTPYCITVDFQTLEDDTVTVRDRDTAKQERLPIGELSKFIQKVLLLDN